MTTKLLTQEQLLRPIRREALIEKIKKVYPDKKGSLLFCAGFDRDRSKFHQDSSFYYFVGIDEPALIFMQSIDSEMHCLYEPCYATNRSVWLPIKKNEKMLKDSGIEKITFLGKSIKGYEASPFFSQESVEVLVNDLSLRIKSGEYIFTSLTNTSLESLVVINQLCGFIPELKDRLIDISPLIGQIRRKKDMKELEHIYHAIEITAAAQEAALETIEPDIQESQVQAAIDYIFAQSQAVQAFTSIVGSGKNSTILHYIDNHDVMKSGDVVVVDIGACFKHYAADVTRTYPVSGTYTERQKKIYELVLASQTKVAEAAKPGMYLNNADYPEISLHHIAQSFFKEHGVLDYFPHGIGHFVGLDVHDVGNPKELLQEGDVITIEPGLYFPEEGLGIRIEDMYWIIEGGAVCLTEGITKDLSEIEKIMAEVLMEE